MPMLASMLPAALLDEIEQIGFFLNTIESHYDQASSLAELGVFSSMFAHEVNNLMTQVGGRAQMALMNMDNPELIVRALELACHASTQIAQLSEIFLTSAHTDSPHAGEYAICDIHRRATEFLSDADLVSYGFTLNADCDQLKTSIPPILLQQVLLNLYLNAIRALEESDSTHPLTISTRIEQVAGGAECSPWNMPQIRITVEDTGVGMDAGQIERVFESWEKGSESGSDPVSRSTPGSSPSEVGRGHGLGLAVCKKLLTQADGSIHAKSTPGVGTKMIITLPDASASSKSRTNHRRAA
jgi:signal transduction histidine kinase